MSTYEVENHQERETQFQRWRYHIKEFLDHYLPTDPGEMADIGIGDSTHILWQKFPGRKLDVLDLQPREGVNIVTDLMLVDTCISEGYYDTVVCSEVLEHIEKPWIAAKKLIYLTHNGGRIFITVPSFLCWHPMKPLCDDYWRFMPASIPTLFPYCTIEHLFRYGNKHQPLGICCRMKVYKNNETTICGVRTPTTRS